MVSYISISALAIGVSLLVVLPIGNLLGIWCHDICKFVRKCILAHYGAEGQVYVTGHAREKETKLNKLTISVGDQKQSYSDLGLLCSKSSLVAYVRVSDAYTNRFVWGQRKEGKEGGRKGKH